MLACFLRSGLMVKDETPTSYLPVPTPVMMESKFEETNWTSTPNFCPTALNRSTSKPCTVLPSAARNSLGAYDASVPTTIFFAVWTFAGSLPASPDCAVAEGTEDELDPDPASDSESDPQADRESAAAAPRASAPAAWRGRRITGCLHRTRAGCLHPATTVRNRQVGEPDRYRTAVTGRGRGRADGSGGQTAGVGPLQHLQASHDPGLLDLHRGAPALDDERHQPVAEPRSVVDVPGQRGLHDAGPARQPGERRDDRSALQHPVRQAQPGLERVAERRHGQLVHGSSARVDALDAGAGQVGAVDVAGQPQHRRRWPAAAGDVLHEADHRVEGTAEGRPVLQVGRQAEPLGDAAFEPTPSVPSPLLRSVLCSLLRSLLGHRLVPALEVMDPVQGQERHRGPARSSSGPSWARGLPAKPCRREPARACRRPEPAAPGGRRRPPPGARARGCPGAGTPSTTRMRPAPGLATTACPASPGATTTSCSSRPAGRGRPGPWPSARSTAASGRRACARTRGRARCTPRSPRSRRAPRR